MRKRSYMSCGIASCIGVYLRGKNDMFMYVNWEGKSLEKCVQFALVRMIYEIFYSAPE